MSRNTSFKQQMVPKLYSNFALDCPRRWGGVKEKTQGGGAELLPKESHPLCPEITNLSFNMYLFSHSLRHRDGHCLGIQSLQSSNLTVKRNSLLYLLSRHTL